jgi:UDP-N-acetylmuramyl tripeptide synthase
VPVAEALLLPFDASRRLTGPNLFFPATGAVLNAIAADDALVADWRSRAARGLARLCWPPLAGELPRVVARPHSRGVSLAIAAPLDQLYTATELNEWAWCASVHARDPVRWHGLERAWFAEALEQASDPSQLIAPVLDEDAALARLLRLAAREASPRLVALVAAARARGLPVIDDDEQLSVGYGAGARHWPRDRLPSPPEIDWSGLRTLPVALVSGSNGKTTTVRAIAACTRAQGWRTGYSSTDGLQIDGEEIARGDYSGPLGARTVLRSPRVEAAVLETARGGILRRGLAVASARVAVVTNLSADHFGEYGIDDLAALADVKLTVAGTLGRDGLLVLNADDPLLVTRSTTLASRYGRCPPLGWFAADHDAPLLRQHRGRGGATCGVRAGQLLLGWQGEEHALGAVAAMPLSADGRAAYNVANLAAAALAAVALGVVPATVAATCASFGADPRDNPGRLMRYQLDGVQVLIDYAHNPDGIRGVLAMARQLAGTARLATLVGHAGNRLDSDYEGVAAAVAAAAPDLVVVKEDEAFLRGRAPGEVPALLRAALLRHGLAERRLASSASELEAAELALAWARPGDVVVLALHGRAARDAVIARVERAAAGLSDA